MLITCPLDATWSPEKHVLPITCKQLLTQTKARRSKILVSRSWPVGFIRLEMRTGCGIRRQKIRESPHKRIRRPPAPFSIRRKVMSRAECIHTVAPFKIAEGMGRVTSSFLPWLSSRTNIPPEAVARTYGSPMRTMPSALARAKAQLTTLRRTVEKALFICQVLVSSQRKPWGGARQPNAVFTQGTRRT